jgi:hypothetical protein
MNFKILNEGIENNFLYSGAEYEYDGRECPDDCECKNGGYCRSNYYVNLRMKNIDLRRIREHFLEKTAKTKGRIETKNIDFIHYCVDRLLRINKVYLTDNWSISTSHGYYGDEIDQIDLSNFGLIKEKIIQIIQLTPNKRIEFILNEEYGFLIDKVKDKNWGIINAKIEDIRMGSEEYRKKADTGIYDEKSDLPIGVYVKEGNFYRIIDGYHRFIANKDKKNVEIIVGNNP